ncbi:hypothetical protein [Roseovarius sp. D22-M7]|uniref:hypothetical protein n=1 Tax=Roseovarius sp. D22-M7 TaxID=3127116 RepID=UPI00300FB6AD
MLNQIRLLALCALLAGCAQPQQTPAPDARPSGAPATTPEPAEAAPARADASPATGDLGLTVASLGSAREPGLWLKTPLVAAPGRGRLTDPGSGRSVEVELMPLDAAPGAGSRLSLQGYQALGLSPTALPQLRVIGLGA